MTFAVHTFFSFVLDPADVKKGDKRKKENDASPEGEQTTARKRQKASAKKPERGSSPSADELAAEQIRAEKLSGTDYLVRILQRIELW